MNAKTDGLKSDEKGGGEGGRGREGQNREHAYVSANNVLSIFDKSRVSQSDC